MNIIEKLKDERVVHFNINGKYTNMWGTEVQGEYEGMSILEGNDEYFELILTKKEAQQLVNELQNLVEQIKN